MIAPNFQTTSRSGCIQQVNMDSTAIENEMPVDHVTAPKTRRISSIKVNPWKVLSRVLFAAILCVFCVWLVLLWQRTEDRSRIFVNTKASDANHN